MIDKKVFKALLQFLGFKEQGKIFIKSFGDEVYLKVDFQKEELIYPDKLKVNEKQSCNFS